MGGLHRHGEDGRFSIGKLAQGGLGEDPDLRRAERGEARAAKSTGESEETTSSSPPVVPYQAQPFPESEEAETASEPSATPIPARRRARAELGAGLPRATATVPGRPSSTLCRPPEARSRLPHAGPLRHAHSRTVRVPFGPRRMARPVSLEAFLSRNAA